jgi:hypothetical protein
MTETLSFLPVNRAGDYETVSPSEAIAKYFDYPSGGGWQEVKTLLYLALNDGDINAYTMLAGQFYRIPAAYWNANGILTGVLMDQLVSFGCDFSYPPEFDEAPVYFFQDELDNWIEREAQSFPLGYSKDAEPRQGLWTELMVMGWICSRDRWFTAAIQQFEIDVCADRGGPQSAAAWIKISDSAAVYFPSDGGDNPLLAAQQELRGKLELGELEMTGFNTLTEKTETIDRARFGDWNRLFKNYGLEFISGFLRLRAVSSDVVRLWPETIDSEISPHLEAKALRPVSNDDLKAWFEGLPDVPRKQAARSWLIERFKKAHPGKEPNVTQIRNLTGGRGVPNRRPSANDRARWDAAMEKAGR